MNQKCLNLDHRRYSKRPILSLILNKSKKSILLFGGINPYENIEKNLYGKSVLSYDLKSNKWKEFSRMPGSRHHHSAVICNQKVYIVGGTKPAQEKQIPVISDSVWSFDPNTLEWFTETRLPYPRRDFGLVASKNGFYVIGGESIGNVVLSSTLFYDIKTKIWNKRASLKQSRSGLMVIADTTMTSIIKTTTTTTTTTTTNSVVKKEDEKTIKSYKKIWAAGGILDTMNFTISDQIEEYDINMNIWYTIGYLRIPRCYGKFCIINNMELYCVGGITNIDGIILSLHDVDRYYRETNEWKCITKMPSNRHGVDVISLDDKIIVIGGMSLQQQTTFETIECYSTLTSKWLNDITPLPSPISSTSSVFYNLKI